MLPFENLSGGPAKAYLAGGLTEEILTGLAQFKAMTSPQRLGSAQGVGIKASAAAEASSPTPIAYAVLPVTFFPGRERLAARPASTVTVEPPPPPVGTGSIRLCTAT